MPKVRFEMSEVVAKICVECSWVAFDRAGCSREIGVGQKAVMLTEDPPPTDPDMPAMRIFCSIECAKACLEYWKKEEMLEE